MKDTKTHTLAVKTGTWNKEGEEKNRYLHVGGLFQGEFGQYILMDKTFNPAGVTGEYGSVVIKIFPVKNKKEEEAINKLETIMDKENDDVPF